jgi:hypothetical protein
MEDLAFAALTLGAILANSIGQEPEIWEAARPREGERGTWVELAARGARVAAEGVGLMSAAIAGLIPYRPIWGKLFGERFVKPGARLVRDVCGLLAAERSCLSGG